MAGVGIHACSSSALGSLRILRYMLVWEADR